MQQRSSEEKIGWLSWQVWAVLLVLVSGGIGFTATSLLLGSPKSPNCTKIFMPFASASMKIYCAQLEADQKTAEGLLKAIALVEKFPQDHPLRAQADKKIEEWAAEILDLAEAKFQAGELEEAIAIAEKIPTNVKAYSLVEARITEWRALWAKGEEIYQTAESQLRSAQWHEAFRSAVKLSYLSNQYWANVKYTEVIDKITIAREESSKLDAAYVALRRGDIDNIIKAIQQAQQISQDSYAYKEAQDLIEDGKNKLLKKAQAYLEEKDWQNLASLAERIPVSLNLSDEIMDWQNISNAGLKAKEGTVFALEAAIIEAEKIDTSRPLYNDAQTLMSYWQKEIEGLKYLDKAKEIAQPGGINDLTAAIAQAQLVSAENPLYNDAQSSIRDWNRQIQIMEDQPILNIAKEMARGGTIAALQQAIAQANQIATNRPLYDDAQDYIRKWQSSIERQQDQPLLNQAIVLASTKDYQAAIDLASKIQSGRVLYDEARSKIKSWQAELDGSQLLEQAYQWASTGTPEALSKAIRTARRIPAGTEVRPQGVQAINRWSYQLLALAQDESNRSLSQGIAIAEMIPSGTSAYEAAQSQLKVWREALKPYRPIPDSIPIENTSI